jgi:hypothetical protein
MFLPVMMFELVLLVAQPEQMVAVLVLSAEYFAWEQLVVLVEFHFELELLLVALELFDLA